MANRNKRLSERELRNVIDKWHEDEESDDDLIRVLQTMTLKNL